MHWMRKIAIAGLAGAFATALGFAAAPAQAQTPITFSLDFRALGRHAAWFVALDKGYYKQAGLDVSIISGQGTAQAIQAIEAGTAQIAFSDVAGVVAARANGGSTAKMVSVIYQKAPYAIFSLRDGANVRSADQLAGLEIGSGAGSFTQKVIEAFMAQKGIKTPAKFTNIDPSARVGMLAAKKIPAVETFVMTRPGVAKAVGSSNARTYLLANDGLVLYSNGIVVREDLIKSKPDVIKAFIAASLKGWKDMIAKPDEAADIVVKLNKGLEKDVVLEEIEIVSELVKTDVTEKRGLGAIDPEAMAASVSLILQTLPGAKLAAGDVYDATLLPATPVLP